MGLDIELFKKQIQYISKYYKIVMMEELIEKYPNNLVVREQLTIVYGQKIKLYRELSRSIIDLEPEQGERFMEFDFDRGAYYE